MNYNITKAGNNERGPALWLATKAAKTKIHFLYLYLFIYSFIYYPCGMVDFPGYAAIQEGHICVMCPFFMGVVLHVNGFRGLLARIEYEYKNPYFGEGRSSNSKVRFFLANQTISSITIIFSISVRASVLFPTHVS